MAKLLQDMGLNELLGRKNEIEQHPDRFTPGDLYLVEQEIRRRLRTCDAKIAAEQGRGCGWNSEEHCG